MKTTAPEQIQLFATLPAERAARGQASDSAQSKGDSDAFDALVADTPKTPVPVKAAAQTGTSETASAPVPEPVPEAQAEPAAARLTGQTSPAALEVFWQDASATQDWAASAPKAGKSVVAEKAADAAPDAAGLVLPVAPQMPMPQTTPADAQEGTIVAPETAGNAETKQVLAQGNAPQGDIKKHAAQATDAMQMSPKGALAEPADAPAAKDASNAMRAVEETRLGEKRTEKTEQPKADLTSSAQAAQTTSVATHPLRAAMEVPATKPQETASPVQRTSTDASPKANAAMAEAAPRDVAPQKPDPTAEKTAKPEALSAAAQIFAAAQAQGANESQAPTTPSATMQTAAAQAAAPIANGEARTAKTTQNTLPATGSDVSVRTVAAQPAPAAAAPPQPQHRPSMAESRFEAALAESTPTAEAATETPRPTAAAANPSAAPQTVASASTNSAQQGVPAQAAAAASPQSETRTQNRLRGDEGETKATPDAAEARAEVNRKKDVGEALQTTRSTAATATPEQTTAQTTTDSVEPFSPLVQGERSDATTHSGGVQTANRTVAASPQHIAQQLAQAMPSSPDQPVEVSLSPEELGKVRMTLHSHDGSITVSVQAERPETLDLMRRNIDSLARDFREMGYSNISFDFGQQADQRQSAQDRAEAARMFAPETSSETERPIRFDNATLAMQRSTNTAAIGGLDLRI
ncbi:flagellar hook-length control protein FliK [Rhodobacter aestuarii]|uniref:Flagellar hook-length control protein FliK n=1 Tax=Rhodobacter aestuarii TaxID=453582 RepID=A0A1N7LJY1_9RHOB|nr:flagellar hook-length control protein FliK [Rhodobacter aestuarii]PTV95207.1 flagellar hook-length control protein FliK [Rhodobacter aestuarii]SIS74133.1 Flagellar hook-length control protein FliK [Rhodobacter aestuarii]